MVSRFHCSIDGKLLNSISDTICVTDINESAKEAVTEFEKSVSDGSRFIRKLRTKLVITVEFCLREQDDEKRMQTFSLVQNWARAGGWFTRSDRPGQRINVHCTELPSLNSALKWTEKTKIRFTAFDYPYWENFSYTIANVENKKSVFFPGNANAARAEATINSASENITQLKIDTGVSVVEFIGLNVPTTKSITIGYDSNGYLFAKAGNDSILQHRAETSSDDFFVACGFSMISVQSNAKVSTTIKSKGAWL